MSQARPAGSQPMQTSTLHYRWNKRNVHQGSDFLKKAEARRKKNHPGILSIKSYSSWKHNQQPNPERDRNQTKV